MQYYIIKLILTRGCRSYPQDPIQRKFGRFSIMGYEEPGYAYCPPKVRACRVGEGEERGPAFCPSNMAEEDLCVAKYKYNDPFMLQVGQESARVESEGYCKWTRMEEIWQFAKKMGFERSASRPASALSIWRIL